MTVEALTIPGLDVPPWYRTHKGDPTVVRFADRHYSRVKRGTNQVGGPGRTCVLITPDQRAVWVTKYNIGGGNMDGFDAFRCGLFRNEGPTLSSTLIQAAMLFTESAWPERPKDEWITWVNPALITSENPGYCFKKAGWWHEGETQSGLLIFRSHFLSEPKTLPNMESR